LPLAVTSVRREGGFFLKAFLGIQKDGSWAKPAKYTGFGEKIEELIERAYNCLSKPVSPAETNSKRRALITRNQDESIEFATALGDNVDILHYPVYEIKPVNESVPMTRALSHLDRYDWIIFTSKNSVRIFEEILHKYNVKLSSSTKFAAVGRKTAAYLEYCGYTVSFIPEREDASGLVQELPVHIEKKAALILLPQGEEAPDLLEKGLSSIGHEVERITIYKTVPTEREKLPVLDPQTIDFFVFTSPLAVTYYKSLGHDLPKLSWVTSIGRPTAEALAEAFRRPDYIPVKADLEDIAEIIREQV